MLVLLLLGLVTTIGRRQKAVIVQTADVKVDLLDLPGLLHLPLVVGGLLAVAEDGDGGLAAVGDVDAVDVPVVAHDGLGAGLPEDAAFVV